jgi:hypothetical protein
MVIYTDIKMNKINSPPELVPYYSTDIRLLLVDKSREVVDSWRAVFSDNRFTHMEVNIMQQDWSTLDSDIIVCPITCIGGISDECKQIFGTDTQRAICQKIRDKYHGYLSVGRCFMLKINDRILLAASVKSTNGETNNLGSFLCMKCVLEIIEIHNKSPKCIKKINNILVPNINLHNQMPIFRSALQMRIAIDSHFGNDVNIESLLDLMTTIRKPFSIKILYSA